MGCQDSQAQEHPELPDDVDLSTLSAWELPDLQSPWSALVRVPTKGKETHSRLSVLAEVSRKKLEEALGSTLAKSSDSKIYGVYNKGKDIHGISGCR